jgi:hypothetical protein
MPPGQRVDANTMTKASFGKNTVEREFESALIYRLQRKESLESNDQFKIDSIFPEDTSINPQLLVIWRPDNRYDFSACVLLIKHSNTTTLSEDELKKLDYPPLVLFRNNRIIENTWLLDDATVLMTTSRWEKQIRKIEITISRGTRKNSCMKPLRIPSDM